MHPQNEHPLFYGNNYMKERPVTFAAILLVSICLSFAGALCQTTYDVVRLPARIGYTVIGDEGLNNRGTVVGSSGKNPQRRGFVWKNGTLVGLPTLGGTCSRSGGVNELDVIVGSACLSGDAVSHAVIWRQRQITDIDTFGGTGSSANRINRNGDVVGLFYAQDQSTHGFLWSNGLWSDLGNVGGSFTVPLGVNESGMVVGESDSSDIPDPIFQVPPQHSFVWQAGVITDLGEIFGGKFSYASDIDEAGNVVGASDLAGDRASAAYFLKNGTITQLPGLPGYDGIWSEGMNHRGQLVGSAGHVTSDPLYSPPVGVLECPCTAVLWEGGKAIDLSTRVGGKWTFWEATSINDNGEILAHSATPSDGAVLLIPQSGSHPQPVPKTVSYSGPKRLVRRGREIIPVY
jgi:probable HAF family extracellular repeat protein